MYKLKAMTCKSALHKLKRNMPYDYDLNLYKGCSHNCMYCYARYADRFKPEGDGEKTIYAKVNIVEHLEKELSAFSGKRHVINLGGVTDAYQEAEKTAKLMRGVLKVLIKYNNPIVISTKSDLLLRDLDLIEELAHGADVNIVASLSTVDEDLAKKIEPGAANPQSRLKMIGEVSKKTSAMTGVHLFPVLPLITDGYNQVENCYRYASEQDPDYFMIATLYLRGDTKKHYLNQVRRHFPSCYSQTVKLYQSGKLDLAYKRAFYERIQTIREKYKFKLTAEEAVERLKMGQIGL